MSILKTPSDHCISESEICPCRSAFECCQPKPSEGLSLQCIDFLDGVEDGMLTPPLAFFFFFLH
ncbi:rCG41623 [Rattus norvegicus]|uniref:RCG41623 n=1 Tax=Rattus norvegicus TaxID=10116 RepID=A6IHD8_RAT|nr:rCG41623 [Rattus norvegicus]